MRQRPPPEQQREMLVGERAEDVQHQRGPPSGGTAASRGRGRKRPGGARSLLPAVHPSAQGMTSASALPVLGEAALPSTGGVRDVLRPAESGHSGDGSWNDAALPARSVSPYAPEGLLLSPPPDVGEDPGIDVGRSRHSALGHGQSDDDIPLHQRLWAPADLCRSESAAPGPSAGWPPWTAPEMADPDPLSLYGSKLPPRRPTPAVRTRAARLPDRTRPENPAPLALAAGAGSQVPSATAGKKGKSTKKVKTADEKRDTISTDLKALTKEWMACKGELVTVCSMLATLMGQVNVGVENGGHVLDVVKHIAEKPSMAALPVDAAAVGRPTPEERPRSARAQARDTMRWFKSLKVRLWSVTCSIFSSVLLLLEVRKIPCVVPE